MAESFGTGAGIVGVISLAIQITQVVVQFGVDWKDAPDNFKSFMVELGTLRTVLSETHTNIILNPDFVDAFQNRPSLLLSQLGPNTSPTTDTNIMLETCRRELESLLNELKKRGQGHRLGWERFKGAFLAKNTRQAVESLCRQCQTLNNMLSIDATALGANMYKEVRESRKEQQDWHRSQEQQHQRQAILDWLTPIDYATQQNDYIAQRQTGTGQWLLDSAEFQSWLKTNQQILFCPGIPGAGKTILASIVVEELKTRFQTDASTGIAYLYCNFKRSYEQKLENLLLSLLKQLASGQQSALDAVKSLYDHHQEKKTRPSCDEISKVLHSITPGFSRVFIVIDALDECQASDGCRARFVSEIINLKTHYGANILATSRFIPEITDKFRGATLLEIRASEEDIGRYLEGHMSQLPKCVSGSFDLQEKIKSVIIKTVDGMFLLAQLHLHSLTDKTTPRKITRVLEKLPKGSGALDQAYEEAIGRIQGQEAGFKELAWRVLSWITCAERPLTSTELQHALAVEPGDTELGEDNLQDMEEIVSSCAGLVIIDEQSNTIRLVHYTTQEYFERTRNTWFPDAEAEITTTCVTYLSFRIFERGFCQTDEEFEERLRVNRFFDYAARHWGHHARKTSSLNQDLIRIIIDFFDSQANIDASSQGLLADKYNSHWIYTVYSQVVSRRLTGLHLSGIFGIEAVVQLFLDAGKVEIDSKDDDGQTPFSWATKMGHEAVVKLLLDNNKVEVNSKDKYNSTPLLRAARNGHEAVVKLLLDNNKVEVNSKDKYNSTPLLRAARNGHEAVVKLLLDNNKVEINSRDTYGSTPLSWATRNGHEAVVELLLDNNKVEVNSKDMYGSTPLLWAALNGHEGIVKLLLDNNKVDINSKDKISGNTPLLWAAKNGHEGIVKLLLNTDKVEVDSKDNRHGQTPLSWAAQNGHESVVKLLLGKGADSRLENINGRTAVLLAILNEHDSIEQLLVMNGAPEPEDIHGLRSLFQLSSF